MSVLASGLRIQGYEVVRRIALGAMSEVYEARHLLSGSPVAIKVLQDEWCHDGELLARFLNEAHSLEAVRHPHLVTLLDWGTLPQGRPFMILEWLPFNLGGALASGGTTTPSIAARVGAQVADALATLHDCGLVHRDLKPANVLFADQDLAVAQMKLADLGLAKVVPDRPADRLLGNVEPAGLVPLSTGGSAVLGTWDYMAPEQWVQSKTVGPQTDVYALGVLVFQLLAGRLPFLAEAPKDLMYFHILEPPPLRLLDEVVAPATRAFIARMLSKVATDRPAMREVMTVMARFADQG
jgi:eukaryotic-like serine/threonine-protein kinase